MRIAIIGTGNVGRALAEGFSAAGHEVVAGSRDPAAHRDFPVPVASAPVAADGAEVVVNATPGIDSVAVLRSFGREWLDGKILLDTANAADHDNLLVYPNASLAEVLQSSFPGTHVVKALNTFNISVMTDPQVLKVPTTAFVSGDDPQAKAVVAGLLRDLGWGPGTLIDLGGLSTARAVEHYYPLFLATYGALGTLVFNSAVVV
ncbi:NADPH-dependent F420 reductase [Kineosporia babensis]|uniref:NAD(P)-binding domain-containing protein n=1 Tax=Kineosporia babensis TaxID=499548 RepID=A0A9X1NIJ2_9ACTN|nr:NAD(P)-binding domain-containing protein [Kineosporia babensis]MCD5314783.1 NAD(P)-binding domain-containing protein [Kineosporia babensis]